MRGIQTIIKKELADHFASYRFTIIFALIAMISLITAYMVGWKIKTEMEGIASQSAFLLLFTLPGAMGLFSLVQFVAFLARWWALSWGLIPSTANATKAP